jgi:capsid assembly protease
MSRYQARAALNQLVGHPVLISQSYIGSTLSVGSEVTSSQLQSDLRDLADATTTEENAKANERRAVLLSSYGYDCDDDHDVKPFIYVDGFAIIPIHGLLLNRFSWSWSWVTGYNFIRNQINAAMADPQVEAIIYDVNSYGGMVMGCEETADLIYQSNAGQGGKTAIAVVDANCYSAAYMLASQCDHIAVTPSGGTGSIGVLMMHVDMSKAIEDFGIKITLVHAGAHKVDGNAYEPLSAEVRADFQAEVDAAYDMFVAKVVRGRDLSDEEVRGTEARSYGAEEALTIGLVDAVENPSDAVEAYFSDAPDAGHDDDDQPESEEAMAPKPATGAATQADTEVTSAAALEAAAASARTAERERVKGIQGHANAVGRAALAAHLAMNTDLDVETAAGILAASEKTAEVIKEQPAGTAATEENHFKNAMDKSNHPNLGASATSGDGEDDSDEAKDRRRAQSILALQHGPKRQEKTTH